MESCTLDKKEIAKDGGDNQNISIETDTDDIVPMYIYTNSQKPKQEDSKVELILNQPDSLRGTLSLEKVLGFAEVVEALEKENKKMEKSIRRLIKKEIRIEKGTNILREMLSELLLKLSS